MSLKLLTSQCRHNCTRLLNTVYQPQYPTHHMILPLACSMQVQSRALSRSFFDDYLSTDFAPIGYAQTFLDSVHDMTGLPWWATLAISTFTLRTVVTLPLSIYSAHIMTRIEMLQPEFHGLNKQLKAEVASAVKQYQWDNKTASYHFRKNMKRLVKEVFIRENCHPFKASIVAWIQLPMWFSMSFALRNMAGVLPLRGHDLPVLSPDMAYEGTLWFSNLLLPDSTWLLPLTMAAANLFINEMFSLRTVKQQGISRAITIFMRGLCVCMIPIAASVPSCMSWYWTCSSMYGLIQNVAMRLPKVRRLLRIRQTPNESQTPFKDMYRNAKIRYGRETATSTKA